MLYTYYDKKTMEYELYSNISYCFMAFVAFMKIGRWILFYGNTGASRPRLR